MLLFIFESIGTPELFLIGLVALIFLGPRKLPDLARKAGKISSELKKATSEFKDTWQREVEDEMKDFQDLAKLEDDIKPVSEPVQYKPKTLEAPTVKSVENVEIQQKTEQTFTMPVTSTTQPNENTEKENWF